MLMLLSFAQVFFSWLMAVVYLCIFRYFKMLKSFTYFLGDIWLFECIKLPLLPFFISSLQVYKFISLYIILYTFTFIIIFNIKIIYLTLINSSYLLFALHLLPISLLLNIMGACAGLSGPQRKNRQAYLSDNNIKKGNPNSTQNLNNPKQFKDIKKQPQANGQKNSNQNQGLVLTSKYMSSLEINGNQNPTNGRSPLMIRQLKQNARQSKDLSNIFDSKEMGSSVILQKGKSQIKDSEKIKKYQSIRDIDTRNSQLNTSHSRFFKPDGIQRNQQHNADKSIKADGGQLDRISQLLQNSKDNENLRNTNQNNSPQSFSRMVYESRNINNLNGNQEYESSNVSPYNVNYIDSSAQFSISRTAGLAIKKKRDLQIIQQLIHQEVKTPQYIKGLRQKHAQDIPDFLIDINGKLPSFEFTPVYTYLKDLKYCQSQHQQKNQHNSSQVMIQSK